MLKTRVIPLLLLNNGGLYKGKKFKNHKYIGDPVNTVKLFNDKEVDEIMLLDIGASVHNKTINYDLLEDITKEAFMPFAYGGGIRQLDDVKKLFALGVEKIVLGSYALENPVFIKELSERYGSQSIVISLDVKKDWLNRNYLYSLSGTKKTKYKPLEFAKIVDSLGAGEILLNSIENDGLMQGYDLQLIKTISEQISIPLIASGGAGKLDDLVIANKSGANAVAAGSLFVFHGPHRAVLISYPEYELLRKIFENKL